VLASYKRSQGFRALLQGSETDAAVGAPLTSATNQNMMVLNGDTWELHYSGAEGNADGTINDVDGIRYYALLIAETLKGRPTIPAEELVRLKNSRFSGPPNRGKAGEQEAAVYSESYQKTHEPTDQLAIRGGIDQSCTIEHKGAVIDDAVIDTDTVETCRKRIEIIDMELEGLKMKPNSTEADYALMEQRQAEKENIEDYLTRSTIPRNRNGRSARWAKFSHSGEKARKAVDMAMRRARKRMEKQDCLRPLVEHLVASVTAGRYLSYNGSHDWQIEGFPSRPKTRS